MKKYTIVFPLLLALLFVSACTPSKAGSPAAIKDGASKHALTALNRDRFNSYTSKMLVKFDGASSWTYELQTRKSPDLREMNLHMDGLTKSENPGDIRMVTDGKTTWMIGPGTDGECVQFSNNQGMDPTLLYPEQLAPIENLKDLLPYKGEETVSGIASLHYSGSKLAYADWKTANVDVWQDKASAGLVRFSMQASGTDPFFGKGAGNLSANYEASALDVAKIEPVTGCEISIPLPDTAVNYVRLPGLASFEIATGPEEMRNYFQTQLQQENWTEQEPAGKTESATVLSYQRNGESVEIQIQALSSGGSKVKIIFLKEP